MAYLFACFLFYSFLGFILEILYSRLIHAKKLDRKCFLISPLCPVYGLGALAILTLPTFILAEPVFLFFVGSVSATLVEYGTALFYERGVGVQFWDYSQLPLNISGRICLIFSFFWGALACLLVYVLHPILIITLSSIPASFLATLFLFVSMDSIYSLILLHKSASTDSLKWYVLRSCSAS